MINTLSLAKTTIEAWLAALMYTFQVYFDFSGYSDTPIGSAYLLNIRLPVNFRPHTSAQILVNFGEDGTYLSLLGYEIIFIYHWEVQKAFLSHLV